ncbi:MAG: sensor histidine kinase [Ramlibacter sp.]
MGIHAATPTAGATGLGPLASNDDWAWEQDRRLRFVHIRAADPQAAFDAGFLLGHSPWEVAGARPAYGSWEDHKRDLSQRRPFHGFVFLVAAAGKPPRYLSATGAPWYDADGNFAGYRGTARDITRQWLQQRRLDEAEVMLKVAATLGRFGAWSVDLATSRLTWTDRAKGIQQVPASHESECGKHILALYAPEDRERLLQAYVRCIGNGTPFDLELQALDRRRQRVWVRVIGAAVRGPANEIVGVQGAFQDIHAAKAAAEADRQRAQRMLTTLDSLTDGFITLDRSWRITYVNPAAEAGVDRCAAELVGLDFWDAFPAARDSVFEENYRAAMAQGVMRRFDAPYPPLGRWFRVSAFPSEQGIALSFTDITAAHEAHEQLLHMNAELERRVQERTEELRQTNDELAAFTLAVAHELREPLAGIAGFSRAVEERLAGRQEQKTRHFLSRIRAGVTRMEGMMDALLELAHVGRAPLERRRVNLTALAECTVEILRAGEPGRDAQVDVEPGLAADGDARLLRTLLENLLGSVWRASAGKPRTVIGVGRRADGAFCVRDNGADQAPAHPPDLSRPHERLRVDGEAGGDRIALASARRVVERHGGRLWAEVTPEGGQMFCFSLPE